MVNPLAQNAYQYLEPNLRTQAGRVIAKFGGAPNLARALASIGKPRHETSVYRWDKPIDEQGTGGLIPGSVLPDILEAARVQGIILNDNDLSPLERDVSPTTEIRDAQHAKALAKEAHYNSKPVAKRREKKLKREKRRLQNIAKAARMRALKAAKRGKK